MDDIDYLAAMNTELRKDRAYVRDMQFLPSPLDAGRGQMSGYSLREVVPMRTFVYTRVAHECHKTHRVR